jgi:nucleotide-binding universal stress UspA family protein
MSIATHILLATDFSDASEAAIAKSGELARNLDCKLTVLHVHGHPPGAPEVNVPPEKIISSADLDTESIETLKKLTEKELADVNFITHATLEHGSTALAICEYAGEHGVDLIVMGRHGRTGITRFLIGSVSEKVLRHAVCGVMVVPNTETAE